MQTILEFKLDNPIQIQKKKTIGEGYEFSPIDTLYCRAPAVSRHRFYVLRLRSLFWGLVLNIKNTKAVENKNDNEAEQKNFGAKEISQLLQSSNWEKEKDQHDFYTTFNKLFCDVVFVDNGFKQVLDIDYLNNMEIEQHEKLIAEYLAYFFMTSWLSSIK